MLRSRKTKSYLLLLGCKASENWHSRFKNSSVMFLMLFDKGDRRNLNAQKKSISIEIRIMIGNSF